MIPLPEPESEAAEVTPGFAILLTFGLAFFQLLFIVLLGGMGLGAGPALWGISAILAFGFAFRLAIPRIQSPPGVHLGFVRPPPLAWWAGLFLVASVLLISEADNVFKEVWPVPEELTSVEPPENVAYQLALALVLVAVLPATQEILFRGLLLPPIVRLWGAGRGILFISALNALAFGLINPWAFASVLTSALVLGVLRHSSRSVLPCLLLHVLFGLITFMASREAFQIPGFDDTTAAHTPMEWLAPAALLSGIGLGLCRAAASGPGPAVPTESPRDES